MAVLEVKELTKKYGQRESEVIALDHVSFFVERGEFVAIIGASGSGKSTLMHMIGGIDRPTGGSVIIEGNDILSMSEDELAIFRRRNLGIVYQFYNLIPTLTAEENIALPWKLDGRKENQKRLADTSFDAVTAYYEADCEAERILGELRAGVVEDGVTQSDTIYVYQCPVNDTQSLCVAVEVNGADYEVREWKLRGTVEWEPEKYIELLDIEDI